MFYAIFALMILWFFLLGQFTEKMKKDYPEKYEELGSPAIGFSSPKPLKSQFYFMRFLFKRQFRSFEDRTYSFFGNLLLGMYITIVIGIFVMTFFKL